MTYNFCAGPAMLPMEVMKQAQQEMLNWQQTGCSVMEVSHRSKQFIKVYDDAISDLKELMSIPDDYSILFMHGGGRGQFSAVPLNLCKTKNADYITTGSWSLAAVEEAKKYCSVNAVNALKNENNKQRVTELTSWVVSENADFIHFCPNETVDGIEIFESPRLIHNEHSVPVVADMSSTILSREIDVRDYDLIYAGAQKNIGPSGLSIVIVKNALLERSRNDIPAILNYKLTQAKDSMFNTPPTFAIYLAGLVFKWLKEQGGVANIERLNKQKAEVLYNAIDRSSLFTNHVHIKNRSRMNVTFTLPSEKLTQQFLLQAEAADLVALKGHRSVGGIRASIYNAMPIEGVVALVNFMEKFEQDNQQNA